MFAIPSLRVEAVARQFKLVFQIGDHHHFDCMMLCQVIADADADLAAFATVNSDKCCLGGIVVKNGVRFRTELRTETAGGFTANGLIDMRD